MSELDGRDDDENNNRPFLQYYHPYRRDDGSRNPDFSRSEDALVLDLKRNIEPQRSRAIDSFTTQMETRVLPSIDFKASKVVGAVVPGHQLHTVSKGLLAVMTNLAERYPITFDLHSNPLVRHTDVPKLADGGNRRVRTHLDSIRMHPDADCRNKTVLLIDDVATTWNSLRACKRILLDHGGASRVLCLAFAHTVLTESKNTRSRSAIRPPPPPIPPPEPPPPPRRRQAPS